MADDLALTPRTRQLLLIAADLLFDEGREDLDQDDPNPWGLFDLYPRLVATQSKDGRRQALRSYDQLAADIRELGTPIPRCTADEVALWLMLDRASAIEADRDAWSPRGRRSSGNRPVVTTPTGHRCARTFSRTPTS